MFIQIFEIGVFSSDPHPGNFLIKNHLDKNPIIVPLDFGQNGTICQKERDNLKDLMYSFDEYKEKNIDEIDEEQE
jgi:predicted unusual protein kinase regulating ubiquinone biosynthesis (AarF/ABC1/UbiB family)